MSTPAGRRPSGVVVASYLLSGASAFWLATAIGTLFAVPQYSRYHVDLQQDPAAGPLVAFLIAVAVVVVAVPAGLGIVLAVLDARGSSSARTLTWIFSVVAVGTAGAILVLDALAAVPWHQRLTTGTAALTLILVPAACVLLALPSSRTYYRAARTARAARRFRRAPGPPPFAAGPRAPQPWPFRPPPPGGAARLPVPVAPPAAVPAPAASQTAAEAPAAPQAAAEEPGPVAPEATARTVEPTTPHMPSAPPHAPSAPHPPSGPPPSVLRRLGRAAARRDVPRWSLALVATVAVVALAFAVTSRARGVRDISQTLPYPPVATGAHVEPPHDVVYLFTASKDITLFEITYIDENGQDKRLQLAGGVPAWAHPIRSRAGTDLLYLAVTVHSTSRSAKIQCAIHVDGRAAISSDGPSCNVHVRFPRPVPRNT